MIRSASVHYINPYLFGITPNANASTNDLFVYTTNETTIKVYCPKLGLDFVDGAYPEWKLTGRNRRLAQSEGVYTIYARLSKTNRDDAYIVFAPMVVAQVAEHKYEWYDKYSYLTRTGLSVCGAQQTVVDDPNYWYVRLGEVSEPIDGQRVVDLDTGILGTAEWNNDWALNPDALPLRIDMEYRLRNVADEEWDEWTAITRYVRWNQVLHVKAQLIEGWTGTDITRFHHWEVTRDTGNADADSTWNDAHDGRDGDSGDYTKTDFDDLNLVHLRGTGDDFNGVLQALFTLTAYELNPDYTAGSEEPQYLPLISSSFSVIAETVETFDLEESSSTVTYNPQTGVYVPAIAYNEETHQYSVNSGVTIRLRAKDADGNTFYPTDEQISAIGLYVYYLPIGDDTSNVRRLTLTNGRGTLPSAPFLAGKSVEVWLQVGAYSSSSENIILSQKTITYIRFGAKGDTPINCYRWYKEGLTPVKPTATNSDEPAPASGDATGASNVYPTDKWSSTVPDRPSTGEWLLWMCSSIRHGDNTRDAWSGPVQMSGTKGDAGEDATDREYIYMRLTTYPFTDTQYHPYPSKIDTGEVSPGGIAHGSETNKQLNDWVPNGWSDTAMPATSDGKYVYMSARIKESGQPWGAFSAPVLWSNWGVQGMDGDGVQYLYKLFSEELDESGRMSQRPSGATFNETTKEWECTGWSDDPLAPTSSSPFCYCAIIKKINGSWNEDLQHHGVFEKLGLWSKWAEDGASITKDGADTYRYAIGDSGINPPASGWNTTKPSTFGKDKWLWTETTIHWSDNSNTVLYSAERNPNDGAAGQDIVAGTTTIQYAVANNNTTQPSTWYDYADIVSQITPGKWLWTKATTPYYKGSTSGASAGSSTNYTVSYIGTNGTNGRALTASSEHYNVSNSSSTEWNVPSSGAWANEWTTDPNVPDQQGNTQWNESHRYLWNYEKMTYTESDGSTTIQRTTPKVIAIWTEDGKGIDSITNYYAINDDPLNAPQSGWDDDAMAPTPQNPYLWNYEVITWTDGSTPTGSVADAHVIGHYGKDGISVEARYAPNSNPTSSQIHTTFQTGDKYMSTRTTGGTWSSWQKIVGENGAETDFSFGISQYKTTTNAQTAPSDISTWSDAPMDVTTQKPYLWAKVVQKNSSGSVISTSYIRLTGEDGDNGDTPMQAFRWNQSPTTAPSPLPSGGTLGNWSATAPNRPFGDGDHYLWMTQTVKHTAADGTVTYDTWSAAVRISGNNGAPGEDADNIEWIYKYDNTGYDGPTGQVNPSGAASGSENNNAQKNWVPNGWYDHALGVSSSNPILYASFREITVDGQTKTYGAFQPPVVWSHYGRNGIDGDGVEYAYIRTKNNVAPKIYDDEHYRDSNRKTYADDEHLPRVNGSGRLDIETNEGSYAYPECTDNPQGTDSTWKYEWVIKRTKDAADGSGVRTWKYYQGEMSLWSNYAADADVWTIEEGQDGEYYWFKNGVKYTDTDHPNGIIAEGKNGTGVEIKGGVDVLFDNQKQPGQTSLEGLTGVNVGECYTVTANKHLYFYDGTTAASAANPVGWRDLGKFSGEDGLSSYMHIAYADNVTFDSQGRPTSCTGFTTVKQKNAYDWVGLRTNNSQTDPTTYTAYEWNKVKGAQGEPGADAVDYKIGFTDNTFALDPNTNKSVISIKGVVYRTEGSNTPTQVSLTGQDLAMRYIKNDGTTQELSLGGDFGIQNNEFVCTAGNGSFNTNFKTFIVEYKPDGQNILARGIIALTVYGEKGMEAIRGYADYLYDADDTGSMPAPSAAELGKINLKEYSGNQNRIEICELVSGSYVWKGYGKTDYPDGTMFVCKIDNHIYRASARGWVDEGRFKGDNAVVYKIEFGESVFARDPDSGRKDVNVIGTIYKIDGGNTSVFTNVTKGTPQNPSQGKLSLVITYDNGSTETLPQSVITLSDGTFSYSTDALYDHEKSLAAILTINDIEVAKTSIQMIASGSRGKRNRVYYYAQEWQNSPAVSYLVNDAQAPYFLYNENYYVYNPGGDVNRSISMQEMGTPDPANNTNWQRMENTFKFIITEAIFGSYAHFGSFIINGDWLYSQKGVWSTSMHPSGDPISYFRIWYDTDEGESAYDALTSEPYVFLDGDNPELPGEVIIDNEEDINIFMDGDTQTHPIQNEYNYGQVQLTNNLPYEIHYNHNNCDMFLRDSNGHDIMIPLQSDEPNALFGYNGYSIIKVDEAGTYSLIAKPRDNSGARIKWVHFNRVSFRPNVALDGLSGTVVMFNANVQGRCEGECAFTKGGSIAGFVFKTTDGSLSAQNSDDEKFKLYKDGTLMLQNRGYGVDTLDVRGGACFQLGNSRQTGFLKITPYSTSSGGIIQIDNYIEIQINGKRVYEDNGFLKVTPII